MIWGFEDIVTRQIRSLSQQWMYQELCILLREPVTSITLSGSINNKIRMDDEQNLNLLLACCSVDPSPSVFTEGP